jgi:hypothetical protein
VALSAAPTDHRAGGAQSVSASSFLLLFFRLHRLDLHAAPQAAQDAADAAAAQEDLKRAWSDAASRAEVGLAALRGEHERFAAAQDDALQAAEQRDRALQLEV